MNIFYICLQDKLSQLQQKLQSMRVVQHRLDRLNPHFENNSSEHPCTINSERAINSHEQGQLMAKLQELELKKENMDTMIKTLRNSRQEDVNEATPQIPLHDMIMGPISVPNQNTRLKQMDLLTANRPGMQSMEKTSIRSENDWSCNPGNNVASNGDQSMFSIPSPSLSMLDNLRALEVSHEGIDDPENRRLEHGAKDCSKAILAQPMHYNQNLLLEQRENGQLFGARQRHDNESNFNNSMFSPNNRLSQINHTTLNSKQTPKPDSNLQYDCQQTKGTHNRVEFLHSKPNIGHIRKENRSTVCMDQSDIAGQQECMSGNMYHQCTSAPGTCAGSKIAPICDRIKALEDEINCLYGEVSSISRTTEYSRAKSNVKDREFEAKTTRNIGEANFHTSSDSSYVMLHNSSGGARLMQKDTQLTSSNNKNESENTMCNFESLLFMSLQRQENLVQEQQKEISNLKNCISSSTARLTVVEGDVDGMNAVLRSLIDIIDQKNQHSSGVEVPSFVQPATRSSIIPLHEDQAVANHIFGTHNTQTNHSTKLHHTQHPDLSVTSRTCPRIESEHSIQSGETSFCRSTQNEASLSRLSSHPVQTRPIANESNLPTDANLDISKTYQGVSPNNLNRLQSSTRPYQSISPVINFPATCQPPNEKNIFQEDRNVENMQQYFDNEPWRHFEIDMDNGLGNLNLGRLSLNENASAIGNHNLFVSGPQPNSNNIVRPSGTISPFNNVNTNAYNSMSQQPGYMAYLPTHDRFPQQVDHTSLLEGIQNLIEQPHQASRFARIDDHERLSLRPSETNGEEAKINNDALAIRHKNSGSQKHSIKPMISTPKSNSNEITHSSIMNSFELSNPSATTSALNNQVPPGRRANNYWDNFKSYSRQNRLEVTPSTSQSGINPTARPTAAVGAVFTNGSQRVATSITNGSPMIAQVPPRQQSMLGSNIVRPISPHDAYQVQSESSLQEPIGSESLGVNPDNNNRSSLEQAVQPAFPNTEQQILSSNDNENDRYCQPMTRTNRAHHNSAYVEPYLSNAHSPSRPRRKQKINREHNKESTSSNLRLEVADNNIAQAAAMARAVANNSAAINQHNFQAQRGNKNSVNLNTAMFSVNPSRSVNDLDFHSTNAPVLPNLPSNAENRASSTYAAAMVCPIPHPMNAEIALSRNINTSDNTNIQIVPRTSQEGNQSVPEVAEVSSLTQSIVGHVNNLIRQAEANPERLQELLEEIQTAGNPSSIPFNVAYQEQPSDSPNTNRQDSSISQGETGLPKTVPNQVLSNFADISADDEDENVVALPSCHESKIQESQSKHSIFKQNSSLPSDNCHHILKNKEFSSKPTPNLPTKNPISDNAVNKFVCSRVKPDLIETQHLPNGYLRKSERPLIIDDNSSQSHDEELVGKAG